MACKEQSGFLFAHPCDQPPVKLCTRCQRGICLRHGREVDGKTMCVSCVKQLEHAEAPTARRQQARRNDPYWYGSSYYDNYRSDSHTTDWDARDRAVFDTPAEEAAALSAGEGDLDAS